MIVVIGTVRLAPENIAGALPAMAAMVAASRAEDGCLEYAYSQDLLEPGLVRITEVWRDREALANHFETPHMAVWRGVIPGLGVSDRNLSLYAAGDPEPV